MKNNGLNLKVYALKNHMKGPNHAKTFAKTKRKIPPVLFENNIREGFKISRVYVIRVMMYVA